MPYILIDGYNLLGIAHDNLEKARNNLIQQLQRYSDLKEHYITVVFDGWKSGQLKETKTQVGNVTVIFSRLGENADIVIKRLLSEGSRPWIVVSSDREIADFAWRNGFVCLTTMEFEGKLIHTARQEETEDSAEYDMEARYLEDAGMTHSHQKGNPRRQSRRQRQKLRVLKKL